MRQINAEGVVSFDHEPGDPFPETDTDWERVKALTEEEIHAAALADPDAQPLELLIAQGRLRKCVNVRSCASGLD